MSGDLSLERLDAMLSSRGRVPVILRDTGNNRGYHEEGMFADVIAITSSPDKWWVKITIDSGPYSEHNKTLSTLSWMLEETQRVALGREMGTYAEAYPHKPRPWEQELIFPKARPLSNYLVPKDEVANDLFYLWREEDTNRGYIEWLEANAAKALGLTP